MRKALPEVTLSLVELRDLIAPVLPHCDYGHTLPVLGCVEFRTHGEWLIATASDRYTIGVCRHKVPEGTSFNCLVQAPELKAMLAMFKPSRGADHAVRMTIDGAFLRVQGVSAMFAEATVSYNLYQGEYPRVGQILEQLPQGGEFKPTALDPQKLAKFGAAARLRQPVVLSGHSPEKPIFVRAGEHFVGAIMPVRGAEVADWSDVEFATKPEAGAA
jgi:hypothetical protein